MDWSPIYFFIIAAFLKTSHSQYLNRPGCTTPELDYEKCIGNVLCVNYIDDQVWENGDPYRNCTVFNNINNYNWICHRLHITYKDTSTEAVPKYTGNFVNTCIYLLNISDNKYKFIPDLSEMPNLAILVLSRNLLTTAKLSNKIELSNLEEIDLSFNIIDSIEMRDDEIVYTNLISLNISHNFLTNVPDAIFDSFPELKILDLSYNSINEINIITFEGLKKLNNLYLQYNKIVDINSSLFRFNELEELNFSHNKIRNLKTDDFEKLIQLKKLDLSFNSLLSIEIDIFNKMPLLHTLDLSNNDLNTIDKYAFINVTNLKSIDLSRNNLKVLPTDLFKNKSVILFSVKDNNVTGPLLRGMFEGLNLISVLDISNQGVSSIEDYAFYGLDKLEELLLNDNKIQSISNKCFRMLQNLNRLDLSNNKITSIDFDKQDLVSLRSLSLNNNYLFEIKHEHFRGMNMLQFLDVSNNNISQLETNSFISLIELVNFQISNNPLNGTLEGNTFNGLNSLPRLDISCSLLNTIKNNSFNGMLQLKYLNLSHSKIQELEFNSFSRTGNIDVIDISYNYLRYFSVNITELINLRILFLHDNLLKVVSFDPYQELPRLTKVTLSHNRIEKIHNETFYNLNGIRYLDLSFNPNMKFEVYIMNKMQNLNTILLSGIQFGLNFTDVTESPLLKLQMSHSGIRNVSTLNLKQLKHLESLTLNNNDILKLEIGAFSNVAYLKVLDLSYNKINFIQPGVFKDNTLLNLLNISHNALTAINYGIFRGLISLHTIDMSYNYVNSLQNERFYEVISLNVLIADHNQISYIGKEEFAGTELSLLSIGDNPLPCDILVNLKKGGFSFVITAISLDESDGENVDGVRCNKGVNIGTKEFPKSRQNSSKLGESEKLLVGIRDILFNISNRDTNKQIVIENNSSQILMNMTDQIERIVVHNEKNLNLTSNLLNSNNITNVLLERMIKLLTTSNAIRKSPSIPIYKDNSTIENMISYINTIKQDLEYTITNEKQNILNEIDKKLLSVRPQVNSTNDPFNERLRSDKINNLSADSKSSSGLTETCLILILIILVGCILYKFYKSRVFVPNRRSGSTRQIVESMENSNL